MPVPLRIGYHNLVDDGALLTASSSSGSLTVGKLATEDVEDIWRATSISAWVLADLQTAQEVGAVALPNSNAIPADAVRVRVSNSDPTGETGEVYDSDSFLAPIDVRKKILAHFIEPAVTGRYVRVDLAQSVAPSAGRLFVGPIWTPTRDRAPGAERLWRDWSETTLTRGLNPIRDRRARQRGYQFLLRGITADEVDTHVEAINEDMGTSGDILLCLDVDAPASKTIWGPMEVTARSSQPDVGIYVAEFTVWNRT